MSFFFECILLCLDVLLEFSFYFFIQAKVALKNTPNLKVIQKIKLIIFPGPLPSLLPSLMLCGK